MQALVKQFFTSGLEDKNSQFKEIVERLDHENLKLKESHMSQKDTQQVSFY